MINAQTGVMLLVAAVIGFVELVTAVFDRRYRNAVIIIVAGLVGFLMGMFPEVGVTALQGMVIGFGASGVVTTASHISVASSTPPQA